MSQLPQMRTRKTSFTPDELIHLPRGKCRYELVKGELFEMPPAGGRHGSVAMRIGILLGSHVMENRLGEVFAAETGFILRRDPATVRAPDACFIARDRLPSEDLPPGYLEIMPDLAVEVLSPNDRPSEVHDKVNDWLQAGVRLVWVIDPATRTAMLYRPLSDPQEVSEDGSLDGAEVVPGFTCQLRELFL